jgi:purine-nucleoside phosphorylase
MTDFDAIQQARDFVAGRISIKPRVGIILGSGLGELGSEVENAVVVPYSEIPGFGTSGVIGHRNELVIGQLGGQDVIVMRGRFHFYEGYSMQEVTFPVRVMQALGCEILIVTNAAGGLHPEWSVGDLMRISDQIFLPGMVGNHPLRGPNDDRLGLRFPPMVGAFDSELAEIADRVAREQSTVLHSGTYVMLSGPAFESAAELRMLRIWGGDAVGMSTAPEIIVARHGGMRVLGISLITNIADPDGAPANHEEVIEAGEMAKPRFSALVRGILQNI